MKFGTKILLIILVLCSKVSLSQTIVYSDNMEDTGWTWKGVPKVLINSGYVGGNSRPIDSPPNTNVYTSYDTAFALFGTGTGSSSIEKDTLVYPTVTLNPFGYYRLQFRVCSFGIDTTISNSPAGVDASDYIQIEYSSNGGSFIKEYKITGSNNLMWGYSNNSLIKIANGINSTVSFTRSIGTVGIDLPIGISQFACRLTLVLNGSGESWYIDDVQLLLLRVTALPIELTNFYGRYYGKNIKLFWTTASEINNDYFIIYKSYDGITYDELDRVNGAGNSNILINYEYLDEEICDTIVYYKLRQVDYDGKYSESDPIAFQCNSENNNEEQKCYDILGREINDDDDYDGIKIYK